MHVVLRFSASMENSRKIRGKTLEDVGKTFIAVVAFNPFTGDGRGSSFYGCGRRRETDGYFGVLCVCFFSVVEKFVFMCF